MGEYAASCVRRPPEDVLGHLGRKIRTLLGEGFSPDDIRTALERLRAKGLHPSVLPSLVNEVVNAPSAPRSTASSTSWAGAGAYRPYLDPASEPKSFGGEL